MGNLYDHIVQSIENRSQLASTLGPAKFYQDENDSGEANAAENEGGGAGGEYKNGSERGENIQCVQCSMDNCNVS